MRNQAPPDSRNSFEIIWDGLSRIPFWVWLLGAFLGLWLFAQMNPGGGTRAPSRPLTADEQLTKDAVTLQRMIDKEERERREKFDKEYQRQEREGR